jgi:ATP-dependent DNA ligase
MISYFYPPQPVRLWPNSAYFLKLRKSPLYDAEIKYNGWRDLIFVDNNKIYLYNRHNSIIDINWKIFADHFKKIPNNTVFDAELLHFRTTDLKNVIVIFDVPFYNNKDLRRNTLVERRKYLSHFLRAPDIIIPSSQSQVYNIQQYSTDFLDLYNMIIKRNSSVEEGIVIKKKMSIYHSHPGRGIDTNDWIKIKKVVD